MIKWAFVVIVSSLGVPGDSNSMSGTAFSISGSGSGEHSYEECVEILQHYPLAISLGKYDRPVAGYMKCVPDTDDPHWLDVEMDRFEETNGL